LSAAEKINDQCSVFGQSPSIKGKTWFAMQPDANRIERLVNGFGLPEIVARLIVLRDLDHNDADLDELLNPTLAKHFPDPSKLANLDSTSAFLAQAIIDEKTIGILADFDVDGATSCAVLSRFLMHVCNSDTIPFFIPDRINDGYGPSDKGFDDLKSQGCDIVVVLDSGITSVAPIAYAKSIGLDVIVADHHEPDTELPNADFIINTKLSDDESGYDYLAAVGVTFLLAVGINGVLRAKGFYDDRNEPPLKSFMDLVALGTVCDMVPLLGANRLFVKHGFTMMDQRLNPGLKALLEVSKIKSVPDPYHAGFMLGPRINAGSRVHQSDLGAQLLSTPDEAEATRIAWLLDDCNEKRKTIQKDMTRQAVEKAKNYLINEPQAAGLVIAGEGWHSGLSGLVSGALKDRFGKPSCIITFVENEEGVVEGRSSGRSVQGVHIADIFMTAQKEGLIVKGGGHAMAGGFTILPAQIDAFQNFFNEQVLKQQAQNKQIDTDHDPIELMMSVQSLTLRTAKLLLESLAPYGMGHCEPQTTLSNVHIHYADQVGTNHLRCTVKDVEGGTPLKCMAFRAFDTELGQALRAAAGTNIVVHLRGSVKINEWQGRESVEYHIDDAIIV
jgi:single-stranded-DNA-specific exonuclease